MALPAPSSRGSSLIPSKNPGLSWHNGKDRCVSPCWLRLCLHVCAICQDLLQFLHLSCGRVKDAKVEVSDTRQVLKKGLLSFSTSTRCSPKCTLHTGHASRHAILCTQASCSFLTLVSACGMAPALVCLLTPAYLSMLYLDTTSGSNFLATT